MKRIALLSDSHSYIDDAILHHTRRCDEIWHAGDFGSVQVLEDLQQQHLVRAVYGNIDGPELRNKMPERLLFTCEGVTVCMQHIGGYPGRYAKGIKEFLVEHKCGLFISGHSHILKIMYDDKVNCLHMNPGATGKQGWHQMRTMITFTIASGNMADCKVIELGKR